MNRLSNWINKISSGWITLICLVIFLLFTAFVLPTQAEEADVYSGDVGSPDMSFYYSADELYQFAEAYGSQGRSDYVRARLTFDVVFPLVYLIFLTTAISWATQKSGKTGRFWQRLNLFPVFGLLFDYLENGAAAVVMARYPEATSVLPTLAGILTAIKWIFVGGSFALLVLLMAISVWNWIHSKS
jgi:hypothetical protein